MPKYDYRCNYCYAIREFEHLMEETMELHPCPVCEPKGEPGLLNKMFRPAATHFKGQGWGKVYRTYKPKDTN